MERRYHPHEQKRHHKRFWVTVGLIASLAAQIGATAYAGSRNGKSQWWNPFNNTHTETGQGINPNEFYTLDPNNPDNPNDPQYLVETKPTISLNGFLTVLHKYKSPIADQSARAIYSMLLAKHINPALFLAVAQQETQLGADGGTGSRGDNITNMRPWPGIDTTNSPLKVISTGSGDFVSFSGYGNEPTAENAGHDGYWHAADAWSNAVVAFVQDGKVTIPDVINTMTPDGVDGNQTQTYISSVDAEMQDYYQVSADIAAGKQSVGGDYTFTAVAGDLPVVGFAGPNSRTNPTSSGSNLG